jgi:hypothetical protein
MEYRSNTCNCGVSSAMRSHPNCTGRERSCKIGGGSPWDRIFYIGRGGRIFKGGQSRTSVIGVRVEDGGVGGDFAWSGFWLVGTLGAGIWVMGVL